MRSCFSYFLYVFTCVVIVVFVTNEIKEKKKRKKKKKKKNFNREEGQRQEIDQKLETNISPKRRRQNWVKSDRKRN